MSDNTLKYMIAVAIALLVIHQVGTLVAGMLGMAWGIVSAVVVAAVSFFSMRLARAGGKASFWFLLPTLIFTVVPIALVFWNALTSETSWLERLTSLLPFLAGFGLPVVLLLLVYQQLRKRTL